LRSGELKWQQSPDQDQGTQPIPPQLSSALSFPEKSKPLIAIWVCGIAGGPFHPMVLGDAALYYGGSTALGELLE
jgi:hypothetical protein